MQAKETRLDSIIEGTKQYVVGQGTVPCPNWSVPSRLM